MYHYNEVNIETQNDACCSYRYSQKCSLSLPLKIQTISHNEAAEKENLVITI